MPVDIIYKIYLLKLALIRLHVKNICPKQPKGKNLKRH